MEAKAYSKRLQRGPESDQLVKQETRREKPRMGRPSKKHRGIFERPEGSGVWWVLYYDQCGRRHREKVGFKSAALRIYQQRKTEIQQGKFEPEDVKRKHRNATVPEIIDDYLQAYQAGGRKAIKDTKLRAGYWKELWRDRAA